MERIFKTYISTLIVNESKYLGVQVNTVQKNANNEHKIEAMKINL